MGYFFSKGGESMPNLTLAIPEELLKQARKYALEHGTSVNALIRSYLENLTGRRSSLDEAADELLRMSETYGGRMDRWSREDLYDT
jgi:hypothetical protein